MADRAYSNNEYTFAFRRNNLVEYQNGVQVVAGSNPATPTRKKQGADCSLTADAFNLIAQFDRRGLYFYYLTDTPAQDGLAQR